MSTITAPTTECPACLSPSCVGAPECTSTRTPRRLDIELNVDEYGTRPGSIERAGRGTVIFDGRLIATWSLGEIDGQTLWSLRALDTEAARAYVWNDREGESPNPRLASEAILAAAVDFLVWGGWAER